MEGEKRAARIDEIDRGKVVLAGDVGQSVGFLDGDRIRGSTLNFCIDNLISLAILRLSELGSITCVENLSQDPDKAKSSRF